jgi:hypothetical protein
VGVIFKWIIKKSGMCFSERGNESLESTEGGEFLDSLSNLCLLKDPAS